MSCLWFNIQTNSRNLSKRKGAMLEFIETPEYLAGDKNE